MTNSTDVTLQELSSSLIATFEGCRLIAYDDATGLPVLVGGKAKGVITIGYGHTGSDVIPGLTITQQQADDLLAKDQTKLFALVAGRPLIEAAALVSFGYNCGIGALQQVLGGHATPQNFIHDSKGHELAGLVSRRRLEENLILASQQK